MTNEQLWAAIVNMAKAYNLSCSGLAKLAGLDSTTFNKSKRKNKYGQVRWPSSYSISKILHAVGIDLVEFAERFMPDAKSTK